AEAGPIRPDEREPGYHQRDQQRALIAGNIEPIQNGSSHASSEFASKKKASPPHPTLSPRRLVESGLGLQCTPLQQEISREPQRPASTGWRRTGSSGQRQESGNF